MAKCTAVVPVWLSHMKIAASCRQRGEWQQAKLRSASDVAMHMQVGKRRITVRRVRESDGDGVGGLYSSGVAGKEGRVHVISPRTLR